ncbi:hypothetical protein V9T40_005988 [Parthenolecanium corni]|uniref:Uncharacterized protein n=1 Tax=Parthenolecanium corni TaxID=536013 RepID=A0AAN9YB74_9HEMI
MHKREAAAYAVCSALVQLGIPGLVATPSVDFATVDRIGGPRVQKHALDGVAGEGRGFRRDSLRRLDVRSRSD